MLNFDDEFPEGIDDDMEDNFKEFIITELMETLQNRRKFQEQT